jgi:hypothetical protein
MQVPLSKGQVALIDDEDLEKVAFNRWYAIPHVMGGHYAYASIGGKTTYMHRLIMGVTDSKLQVHHKNHDTLDNRKANLEVMTNQRNNTKREGAYNTSKLGVRGVSIHQSNNPGRIQYYVFRCHCRDCRKCKYFPFTDEGLAAASQFAEEHHAAHGNVG